LVLCDERDGPAAWWAAGPSMSARVTTTRVEEASGTDPT
jgi:hypothetical protein